MVAYSFEAFARLRRFVLREVESRLTGIDSDAIAALADDPDPDAWRPWKETRAQIGQWFLWRDPKEPGALHADKAYPNEDGFIEYKAECGLDFYPECQPARLADDVVNAIAAGEKNFAEWAQ